MSELVLREDREGAATLTLNRPGEVERAHQGGVRGARGRTSMPCARETRKIGLVILRGAGGNFSAGYDMEEVLDHVRAHAKPHFDSEVIEKLAEPAAAGDLRRRGPLLHRRAGARAGGRPHRRDRVRAVLATPMRAGG